MPRAFGVLILNKASRRLWLFIRRADDGKSSSPMKGRCTVSLIQSVRVRPGPASKKDWQSASLLGLPASDNLPPPNPLDRICVTIFGPALTQKIATGPSLDAKTIFFGLGQQLANTRRLARSLSNLKSWLFSKRRRAKRNGIR